MNPIPNKSLVRKITVESIVLIFCAFILVLVANYWHAYTQAKSTHKQQLARQLTLLSESLEGPLWALDDHTITLIGDAYMAGADVVGLEIVSLHDGKILYHKQSPANSEVIHGRQDILHKGQVIGNAALGLSGAYYTATLSRLLAFSIILVIVIAASLTLMMRRLFKEHLVKPLESLGGWTERLAYGDYGGAPPAFELKEFYSLANKFSNMSEKIRSREESLLASERRFRRLFENTEVSIWNEDISEVVTILDKIREDGVTDLRQFLADNSDVAWEMVAKVKVIQVNEATLKLFRAKSEEEMLFQIDKTFGAGTFDVFVEELCAIWDNQKSFRSEIAFRTLDGQDIDAIISFQVPETREGFSSLPVTIIDITERKKTEMELARYRDHLELLVEDQTRKLQEAQSELVQRERLATLGKLTATVSHELRNPLGTLQTALFSIHNCLVQKETHQATRSFELAERSIDRCVNIIEELNSYARVKGLNVTEAAVDEWLAGVFREQALPAEVECEMNFSSGILASFDQEKMRQVVTNLMTNAIHSLQDDRSHGKRLKVSTFRLDGGYGIQVSDNGIGMSQETREKVFEPLFSTKGFGVGLGMVIVKNIVEQHSGQIDIESQPGEGTTVTLRLPSNLPEQP